MSNNKHHFEKSSSLSHCDYEDDTGCMIIKFTSGQTYKYPGVPKNEFEALKAAASPGKHFHSKIRTKYQGENI